MISQGGIRGLLAKYFRHLVPVGVLLLAGLLPLTWFGPGKIINGGDTFWPLDPTDSIARIVSIWDPRVGAGSDAGLRAGDLFPFLFVLRLVQWLGLSSVTGQAIWFCLLMIASGLGMYVLAVASLEAEWSHWGGLIGGLFYQFNPYTVKAWATGHQNLLLGYAMLPLGAMLVVRGLKQSPVKNGALLALLTLWMAPLSSNPALYLVIVVGFLLAMAGLLVCDPTSRNLRKVATFGLAFGGLWLLANAWWLAALAEYAHAYAGQANVREVAARTELAGPLQAHTSFLELLKLQGYFGFYGAHKGEPYMLFAEEFVRPPTTLAILTMVGIALSTLVWARSRKTAALAVAVYLIGLLLVKGMHTPLGVLMAELYQRVPGFWLYRDSYTKFLPLAVAALGYLITLVATELGHRPALQRLGATVGLIGLIGFGAWPLLRGM